VYARVASGYRPGGPNIGCPAVPCTFDADKTYNYELGLKGNVLGGALSLDGSVYYIDWKDLQISVLQNGFLPTANGSRARSQGVELSVQSAPRSGMALRAWVAFSDAKLSEDFPATSTALGNSGDRLPYSARVSGNVSLDQSFPIRPRIDGFVGASISYVGDRKGIFQPTPIRETFPSYTQVDLRAGVRYDTWTVNAYVANLTDKRGVLRGGLDNPVNVPTSFSYTQPRTSGVTVTKKF
jgi:outer membrane receptor protein involved in Fe transport